MIAESQSTTPCNRFHIVLIPGFGGFDALGQVKYYSGVTERFQQWCRSGSGVLHYFDNLPTAGVCTRARRLCSYLAKRMVRGEIAPGDRVVLVGHSTGGLDIRQLVLDLRDGPDDPLHVDGEAQTTRRAIRNSLDAVVFLSVPHWGTNIADWVHSHPRWRAAIVNELRAAVAGSQFYPLGSIEAGATGQIAKWTDSDFLLAAKDALTESNAEFGVRSPSRTADAQEAASELELYLRHMSTDFSVINDLTSCQYAGKERTPAHFTPEERDDELQLWRNPPIRTLSFATLGGRPFRFRGERAPVWDLNCPSTYSPFGEDDEIADKTDLGYRLCYRACAGGPFEGPAKVRSYKTLGSLRPKNIELWDNDGIVNTRSMFWPNGDVFLVAADHLDIVGHYELKEVLRGAAEMTKDPARRYESYDALRSTPRMKAALFTDVWTRIFEFAAGVRTSAPKQSSKKAVAAIV